MIIQTRRKILQTLRAFEAAARHLSFTRAAEELHVTQAAVSHQVKALEDFLDFKLFRRINRSLLLTEEGQTYAPAIHQAMSQIRDATARLLENQNTGVLTVSVLPSFAARWLLRQTLLAAGSDPDELAAPIAELRRLFADAGKPALPLR